MPWSGKHLFGAMLFGWGLFNFVEGILDHYILRVHFVVQRLGQSPFDLAFVASGVVFMLIGRRMLIPQTGGAMASLGGVSR